QDDLGAELQVPDRPAGDHQRQGQDIDEEEDHRSASYFRAPCHAARGMPRPLPAGAALPLGAAAAAAPARAGPTRASTCSMIPRAPRAACCIPPPSSPARPTPPCCRAPPQPTTVGTDRHTSRTPYSPCCSVLTGSTRRLSRATASTTSRI